MTINATAMWLLSLYVALAEERGVDPKLLQGTTQNDIIKEYLARGTYIFPPRPSMRLIVDMYEHCLHAHPALEPVEHLLVPPAGGGGDAGAGAGLRARQRDGACSTRSRERGISPGRVRALRRPRLVLRATPASASSKRCARCARSAEMWDEITRDRYGVKNAEVPALPLRRAGELARPHRGAAREQRVAHPARGARRDAQPRTRAAARSSSRPGTRRSACRGRGTSSGRSACSRSSPTRPTCSSTPTSSTARRSSRRRSAELKRGGRGRDRDASRRWAARSPRSSRAT